MIIELAKKEDCFEIAKIHLKQIGKGFLNQLGIEFLKVFYEEIANSRNTFLIVAKENDNIIGFISGCFDLKKFYKSFIKKNFFKIFFILVKKIFIIKKAFETAKYSKKEKSNLPKAELLSIAVLPRFQGQGVSQKLLEEFILKMKEKNVKKFKVLVGQELKRANKFYQKKGFIFWGKKFVHKNTPSNIYVYNL